MYYYNLNHIQQLNFQINRILTYGLKAGDFNEIADISKRISDIETWYIEWRALANKTETEKRFLHAGFYYRMAEFFLKDDRKEKLEMYNKCIENFYHAIDEEKDIDIEKINIPYEDSYLRALRLHSKNEKGTLLVNGGYDSFIEEFYLTAKELCEMGYSIILFEGPGQGKPLKNGLKFCYNWEKPVASVIDYFKLDDVTLIGISWGGYLALRASAFESRIKKIAAYDVFYDGYDVMTNIMPLPVKIIFNSLFRLNNKSAINKFVGVIRKKSLLADWAISHGMYITGTSTPFEFYKELSKHTMKGISDKVTQDVLLLAGENDHYVPVRQYYRLKKELINAKSLTTRLFTKSEGGEQHCQVGNHMLAVNKIINWLASFES